MSEEHQPPSFEKKDSGEGGGYVHPEAGPYTAPQYGLGDQQTGPYPSGPYAPPQQPQSYGQSGYGQYPPPYQQYPAPRPTNVFAILALVFAFVLAPLGLVFGILSRRQIARTGEQGRALLWPESSSVQSSLGSGSCTSPCSSSASLSVLATNLRSSHVA